MANLYSFYDWIDRIRRYYKFTSKESLWLLISVGVMAFIVGFRFDGEDFVFGVFAENFLLGLVAVVIAVVVHESAHRIFALNMGYKIESRPFMYGLLAGVILALMSSGKVIFLAYSSFFLNIMEKHRLGYFRYQLGYFDLGKVALTGPLANLLLAIAVKSMVFLPSPLADKIVLVNVLFAITNTVPIPPLDGAHIMYASKTAYPLVFGAIVSCGLLLLIPWLNPFYALAASLIIGLATAILFFNYVEPKL